MKGFTLIELLIVIAVTVVLASATIPVFGGWQSMSQLNEAKAQVGQIIRMARQYSIAGLNGERHGVYFDINIGDNDRVIYYQGDSYASRNSDFDLVLPLENAVVLSTALSGEEVNFSKNNGLPSTTGTVSIQNNLGRSYQLRINELGVVIDN